MFLHGGIHTSARSTLVSMPTQNTVASQLAEYVKFTAYLLSLPPGDLEMHLSSAPQHTRSP